MFQCQECGKKFRTVVAAERAANDGCPKCGGVDIDVAPYETPRLPILRLPSDRERDTERDGAA